MQDGEEVGEARAMGKPGMSWGPDDARPCSCHEDFNFYFEYLLNCFSQDPSGCWDKNKMKEGTGGGRETKEEAGAMPRGVMGGSRRQQWG